MVASNRSVFAVSFISLNDSYCISEVDISTFMQVGSFCRSDWIQLFGVDKTGQMLLTSLPFSGNPYYGFTLMDAKTGQVTGQVDGGSTDLLVNGGALVHTAGESVTMVAFDYHHWQLIGIAENNTRLFNTSFPDNATFSWMIAAGRFIHVLCSIGGDVSAVIHYELHSGQQLSVTMVDSTYLPDAIISSSSSPRSILFCDDNTATVFQLNEDGGVIEIFAVRNPPFLSSPSGLATLPQRMLIVGTNLYPQGFVVLNSTGYQVGPRVHVDVSMCPIVPWQDVARTKDGYILLPICNGSLAVYDEHLVHIRTLDLGRSVLPRAVSPSATGKSVYITDDNRLTMLTEYDLQTGQEVRVLQANASSALIDVEVDQADGSIWATDSNPTALIFHWSQNGTLITVWDFSAWNPNAIAEWHYLTVDSAHQRLLVTVDLWTMDRHHILGSYLLWLDSNTGSVLYNYAYSAYQPASGVGVTPDGKFVYIAEFTSGEIGVFHNPEQPSFPVKPADALGSVLHGS